MMDGIAAEDEKVKEVRLAMLASGKWKEHTLFPEHFTPPGVVEDTGQQLADDVLLDYSDVEWIIPTEGATSAEEYQRTMNAMASARITTVRDDDSEADLAGEPEPPDPRGEWL